MRIVKLSQERNKELGNGDRSIGTVDGGVLARIVIWEFLDRKADRLWLRIAVFIVGFCLAGIYLGIL